MSVDAVLVTEACDALEVVEVGSLRDGAQKTVRIVERDGVKLVLKVIKVGSSTPDALRRAQREVELLRELNSPHVVAVASDLVELGDPVVGAAWLEEHLDGDDLTNLVGAPWSWDETASMARQIALGLGAMHAVNVVHRDLSPNNVRQLSNGDWKVMDPGFARHELRSSLTLAGQPGTPGFASPEHLNAYSAGPTPFSDVFCVGVLMFLTLTAQLPIPFTGDIAEYAARLNRVEVADLSALRPDLALDQAGVVKRCLHPQPARRFRDGTDLAQRIENLT